MARPSGPKDYCGGRWTKARLRSFIENILRAGTRKWAPIGDCEREARTRRGFYLCAGCKKEIPATVKEGRKRVNNKFVDHIKPAVPVTGWTNWDDYINNLFCEIDNLQLLCKTCHDEKSKEENQERKKYR
jgi:hypothetical protein